MREEEEDLGVLVFISDYSSEDTFEIYSPGRAVGEACKG